MRLYLVSHNVPFDVAFAASDEWTAAAYVALIEQEGMYEFEWNANEWRKKG